jgi:hypothetical protein
MKMWAIMFHPEMHKKLQPEFRARGEAVVKKAQKAFDELMLELHPDEAGLAAAMVAEALRRDAADARRAEKMAEKKRAKRAAERGGRGEGGAARSLAPELEKQPAPEKADDVAIAALVADDLAKEAEIPKKAPLPVEEGPAGAAGAGPTGFLEAILAHEAAVASDAAIAAALGEKEAAPSPPSVLRAAAAFAEGPSSTAGDMPAGEGPSGYGPVGGAAGGARARSDIRGGVRKPAKKTGFYVTKGNAYKSTPEERRRQRLAKAIKDAEQEFRYRAGRDSERMRTHVLKLSDKKFVRLSQNWDDVMEQHEEMAGRLMLNKIAAQRTGNARLIRETHELWKKHNGVRDHYIMVTNFAKGGLALLCPDHLFAYNEYLKIKEKGTHKFVMIDEEPEPTTEEDSESESEDEEGA